MSRSSIDHIFDTLYLLRAQCGEWTCRVHVVEDNQEFFMFCKCFPPFSFVLLMNSRLHNVIYLTGPVDREHRIKLHVDTSS